MHSDTLRRGLPNASLGEAPCEGLDEINMPVCKDLTGRIDDQLVVEGGFETDDRRSTEVNLDVHQEGLCAGLFVIVDANPGVKPETPDDDLLAEDHAGFGRHRSIQVLTAVHGDHLPGHAGRPDEVAQRSADIGWIDGASKRG